MRGCKHFPKRFFDQSATDDSTVAPVQLSTATDDPVHADAGKKSCFGLRDGRNFQVRHIEADVSFPIVIFGAASQQGKWFVFGPGCQAILQWRVPQVMCEGPKRGKVGAMLGAGTHGRSTVVPESQNSKVG